MMAIFLVLISDQPKMAGEQLDFGEAESPVKLNVRCLPYDHRSSRLTSIDANA